MRSIPFDAQERAARCDLLDELGGDAPTLLEDWTTTTRDLSANSVSCTRCQTPAACQSRSRRQHVMPDP
ncbi:hypothetical protein ACQP1O_15190 [Nocardia sp. CA-151230]|uniref:hypothetical protein n=1 Tax=Nocardia sp. CA-151230 TaxID=3239982 RepID=UPI003D93CFAC